MQQRYRALVLLLVSVADIEPAACADVSREEAAQFCHETSLRMKMNLERLRHELPSISLKMTLEWNEWAARLDHSGLRMR